MDKHTNDKWAAGAEAGSRTSHPTIINPDGKILSLFVFEKDRDRAIAEHNACLGISTEALKAGAVKGLVDALKLASNELESFGQELDPEEWSDGEFILGRIKDALAALKPESEGE